MSDHLLSTDPTALSVSTAGPAGPATPGGLLSADPGAGQLLSTDPAAGLSTSKPAKPATSGGIGGFLSEATQGLNPVKINDAIQQAFWHPLDTAKGLLSGQEKIRHEGLEAFKSGDYVTGSRKMLDWVLSGFLLPMRMDQAADYMQQGETARGLGATADVASTIALPAAVDSIVARLPTRAGAVAALNRGAESRVVSAIAPKVGPQKIRFGVEAERVAGQVARQTTSRTLGGLLDEVGENSARANQALDAAYASAPATQMVSTQPLLARLQQALRDLSARGSTGRVVPATRAARAASLNQAMEEVRALGARASLPELRTLRQGWDEGAQAVFTPQTADNFMAVRQAGHGWADARTALNDHMVANLPGLTDLNANATLWIRAQEVLQAAADVERVRPTVGRSMVSRGLGAAAGAGLGGAWGAAFGAVIGPSIEAAMVSASPTIKLTVARGMARLADALQAAQPGPILSALGEVTAALPSAQRTAVFAQATRLIRDLQPAAARQETAPAAPGAGPPRPSGR
jgi:hypothetical protein